VILVVVFAAWVVCELEGLRALVCFLVLFVSSVVCDLTGEK
jgi:hypothetical protein